MGSRIILFMVCGLGLPTSVALADCTPLEIESLKLNDECPPAFEKIATHKCRAQSAYFLRGHNQREPQWRKLDPKLNPVLNPKIIDLGRILFFDPILSRDREMACASCHQTHKGLSDGRALALGRNAKTLDFSTPPLWNVGLYPKLTWSGHALSLEEQMMTPLTNPKEMNASVQMIEQRLNENHIYQRLFREARLISDQALIAFKSVSRALAEFERSLLALNSPYDRYIQGDTSALSESAERGFLVFRSFVTRCSECHTPPLFTNLEQAHIGITRKGAQTVRIPSLRNIALTAPYMHNGRFESLNEVIDFYSEGRGRFEHENPQSVHWHIRPSLISHREALDLENFLLALTDDQTNPMVPKCLPSGLDLSEGENPR